MIPSPAATPTRSARVLLASVAVVVVATVVLGAPALVAGVLPGAGVLSGSCASAGEVHAGLVVDFGTVDTGTARPANTSDCVADPGANGVTLLAKRFGKSGVRINSSGLICAIDGYPATGCGDHLPNGRYRYWSYWKGGSSWEYSSVGPAGRVVKDGTVDGWHFVEGSASPADGAPGNSGPAGPCGPTTPTTTPPATSTPTSNGGSSGGSSGSGGGSGGSGGQVTPTSTGSSPESTATYGDTPVTEADGSVVEPDAGTDGTAGTATGGSTDDLSDVENASDVGGDSSSSGGLPVAVVAVALVVVALGGGAALRFRGRADE